MPSERDEHYDEPPNKVGHLDLPKAAILIVLFVVAIAVLVTWGSVKKGAPGAAPVTTTTKVPVTTAPPTTISRANVKVQVANGTAKAGVATQVTQQLQTQGWNTLPPVNASSQVATSTVYYAANRKPEAQAIAQELSLPASSVQPLTTSVPVPGAAGDDVVVLIGPNLANG